MKTHTKKDYEKAAKRMQAEWQADHDAHIANILALKPQWDHAKLDVIKSNLELRGILMMLQQVEINERNFAK